MAQLGDLARAKALLRSAARAFGPKEAVARARCVVAEAEIALVSRDLGWPAEGARCGAGDARSAWRPRQCRACALSRGPPPAPDRAPGRGRAHGSPSSTRRPCRRRCGPLTSWWLRASRCGDCGRSRRAQRSRGPRRAAREADIPALTAEVESASRVLSTPAARLIARGEERPLLLDEVEALLASKALVVDACRYVVRDTGAVVSLATRPVLFALARALARSVARRRDEGRADRAGIPRQARR